VRRDFLHLGRYIALGKETGVPAGSQTEIVTFEDWAEHLRFARELAAELDAGVTGRGGFGKALFERGVVAELLQHVVGPRQRADGDAEILCGRRLFFLIHACLQ